MVSRLGIYICSALIGILFIIPGMIKTIRISTGIHKEIIKKYKNFTEVSPFVKIGLDVSPIVYMQMTGVFEIILGTILVAGTVSFKRFACLGLISIVLLVAYNQFALEDYRAMIVPLGYFVLLSWIFHCLGRLSCSCAKHLKHD
ncbi:hypothetical protein Ciccas_009011 [Cichlidogyrus casuarinus]|uniref:DoxX family protein n=1 Tax=Cichlidogyrus casuarinus TaxID=1844966 RepID=A0ABD2Q2M5_9PLAT